VSGQGPYHRCLQYLSSDGVALVEYEGTLPGQRLTGNTDSAAETPVCRNTHLSHRRLATEWPSRPSGALSSTGERCRVRRCGRS
jgi:hypothetical protein